jgi:hypothetical protein
MPGPLSDDDVVRINDALFAGRKIEAIKLYRDSTGAGLKEAKDFVDALEERLRQAEPERFSTLQGKGCFLSLIPVVIGGVIAFLSWA